MKNKQLLRDKKVIIVGGGPAGLTLAKELSNLGAQTTLYEQASNPLTDQSKYTNKSFNITLNQVGRAVLGDSRAWLGSTEVVGRVVHNFKDTGKPKISAYSDGKRGILTSIPRSTLRINMYTLVQSAGTNIVFDATVTGINPDQGSIIVSRKKQEHEESADLVVIADGVHSLADDYVGSTRLETDPLEYFTVQLDVRHLDEQSLSHIHFWRENDELVPSVAIGLPNRDGTISTLLVSSYTQEQKEAILNGNKDMINAIFSKKFTSLVKMEPAIIDQVSERKTGRFFYKSIEHYVFGKKFVVLGDASSASPPWAGFGANTAIFSAGMLSNFLEHEPTSLESAIIKFGEYKTILANKVLHHAKQHGDFLSKRVADTPDKNPVGSVLAEIIDQTNSEFTLPDNMRYELND